MSKKMNFFHWILFYALSNDVKKFFVVTSSTLGTRRDSILKEIFPPGNYMYKLDYMQKLLKIHVASDMYYNISTKRYGKCLKI